MWKQIEATGPHLTYLILGAFLLTYATFSLYIRNKLYLSEPPLATLVGIIFGPKCLGSLSPGEWNLGDDTMQEFTRVVLSVQCFTIGVELPKRYWKRHWRSIAMLLGPVMVVGWLVCALFIWALFPVSFPAALTIAACLTPTDPVLAASVLSESPFSSRVPMRLRQMLSAESGSNDGTSFPFLYIGLSILLRATVAASLKKWLLITIFWQCGFGILLGLLIGTTANRILRFSYARHLVANASYLVFYLLLALFCTGVASTLGVDDFLLAFSAGLAFSRDGWFPAKTAENVLPTVIDLHLNSSMFVYFGASIPWDDFTDAGFPGLSVGKLFALLALILALRRIPIMLTLKPFIPDIKSWTEALFAGHFGPIGVGALFLSIEARAQLETDTSLPLPHPPSHPPGTPHRLDHPRVVAMIWPVICFIVLGSTIVHGLSPLVIGIVSQLQRERSGSGERQPLIGGSERNDRFEGMVWDEEEDDAGEAPEGPGLEVGDGHL
ncbi:Na(+)/H(+) antiporter 2 [Viridothelium virens]|uniref:Na(+)/H(+) antiporter 2 n=1 Tax=Viridothelium virens TaxID=1048519 RepID=A0A6A6GZ95_VIRVR|nr:Na(+)/H(+) antiporter 2 [Viridothelium virens]